MEAIFTIPYSEHAVVELLQKHLPKKDGYSVFIPTSRQQKGIDLLIHNQKTNKTARVQVKSSRSYTNSKDDANYLWFNNFVRKYKEGNADFYILFGLYPKYKQTFNIKRGSFWAELILCLPERDMNDFLKQVLTKKNQTPDRFFGFKFTQPDDIVCNRGPSDYPIRDYLVQEQVKNIKVFLR